MATREAHDAVTAITHEEAYAELEQQAQELLGVDAERAIEMARHGQIEDDIPGLIIKSWIMLSANGHGS